MAIAKFTVAAALLTAVNAVKISVYMDASCTTPAANGFFIRAFSNVCLPADDTPYAIYKSNSTHASVYSFWNSTYPPACAQVSGQPDWQFDPFTVPIDGSCSQIMEDYLGNGPVWGRVAAADSAVTSTAKWFSYSLFTDSSCMSAAAKTLPASGSQIDQWVPVDSISAADGCQEMGWGVSDNTGRLTPYHATVSVSASGAFTLTMFPQGDATCASALTTYPTLTLDGSCIAPTTTGAGHLYIKAFPVNSYGSSGAAGVTATWATLVAAGAALLALARA